MRRRVVSTPLSPPPAEPEYPEYDQVRAEAARRSAGPIDPQILPKMAVVTARRGNLWCTAVLGRPFAGVARVPTVDAFMLLIADELELEPPVPERSPRPGACRRNSAPGTGPAATRGGKRSAGAGSWP
ncbi:hypothetical protein LUR56_39955 [Streptomyces sp. MT29]|nr:hypothetical protein [Streptomyces sp. MT29]